MRRGIFVTLLSVVLSIAAVAHADVLFKSTPNLAGVPVANGLCSNCNGRFEIFSGFELDVSAELNQVTLAVRQSSIYSPFNTPFRVSIYDGPASDIDAPLIYEDFIRIYGDGYDPTATHSTPPIASGFETAVLSFAIPSLRLEAGHAYSIAFIGNDFHLPVFQNGSSPLYGQQGALYGNIGGRYVQQIYNSANQLTSNPSIGFQLDGVAVPEPQTWALMIVGFGAVGLALRRRRTLLT